MPRIQSALRGWSRSVRSSKIETRPYGAAKRALLVPGPLFEQLEARTLLSVGVTGNGEGLQTRMLPWHGQQVEVATDRWLVHLADTSIMSSSGWLSGLGNQASSEVLDALAPDTVVLTAPGMNKPTVRAWERRWAGALSVQPDFIMKADAMPNDAVFSSEATNDGLWGMRNEGQPQMAYDGSAFVPTTLTGTAGRDIDAPRAWGITTGSRNVVIGIIDSGIDYTHPDLYQNIWLNNREIPSSFRSALRDTDADALITFVDLNNSANSAYVSDNNGNGYIDAGDLLHDVRWANGVDDDANGYIDDLVGWDFINNDNDPIDDLFHGTHCAGTIGGQGNNGIGVAGVNWNVSMIPLKFLGMTGSGPLSAATQATDYATNLRLNGGVRVVATSNSWGTDPADPYRSGNDPVLEAAISRAGAASVLFVAAAGNSTHNNDDGYGPWPASFPEDNIIAVAATDCNDQLASFSNWGATTVDLGAPGVNTLSTFPMTYTPGMAYYGMPVGTYYTISGTSMATPHVAGVVGLLAAYNPSANWSQIKQAIMNSVEPISALAGKTVTGGRLNAAGALASLAGMSMFTVSTAVDENDGNYSFGDLSLREALQLAASSGTAAQIGFDPSLNRSTINVSSSLGPLTIASNVQILGTDSATTTIRGDGAGRIFWVNSGVTATISDVTLTNGYATGAAWPYSGGAVYNTGALTLKRVVMSGNNGIYGGAIGQEVAGASVTLVDSTVRNNSSSAPGGAIYITAGSAAIQGSTISGNTTTVYGGGMYFSGTTLTVTGSTVSGNQYEGMRIAGGTATILNSTITNNTPTTIMPAEYTAGGVDATGSTVTLVNTIVAGNSGGDINGTFSTTSHHNLIGDGSEANLVNGTNSNKVGTAAAPISARLMALASNGGLTQTHLLQPDSPAINAGDNTAAAGLLMDQRGSARVVGANVDIGSVEGQLVVTIATDENDGNYNYDDLSLREALALAAATPGLDPITFASGLSGSTITLNATLGRLDINSDVLIQGLGPGRLTINANNGSYGAVTVESGTNVTINDLTITGGFSVPMGQGTNDWFSGGGIYTLGNLTMSRVVVSGNTSLTGGGIAQNAAGANLHLIDCTLQNNVGYCPGGALYLAAGSAQIERTTFAYNYTSVYGAGIYFSSSGTLTVSNSTISGSSGDGIRADGSGPVTILNCTITNNMQAPVIPPGYAAGGVSANTNTTLINSIVAGNQGPDIYGPFTAGSHNNLIGDGTLGNLVNGVSGNIVGTSASPIDAKLSPLGNYGGLNLTQYPQSISRAINAGDTAAASSLVTDERGQRRVVQGAVDIGAVEWQPSWVVSTVADESDGNYNSGDLSLREAVEVAATVGGSAQITFDPVLISNTVSVGSALGPITLSGNVQIIGRGTGITGIKGTGGTRVFSVNSGANVTISDLVLSGGSTTGDGGAIYNAGMLTMQRLLIQSNSAVNGGAIAQEAAGASFTMVDTMMSSNSASSAGCAVYVTAGSAQIQTSTIYSNNNSAATGGGIYFAGTVLTVTNSTIGNNQQEGVRVAAGTATFLNATIKGNTQAPSLPAGSTAGGVNATGSGDVTLINTIVAGNTGGDINGGFNAISHHNLIGDGSEGGLVNGVNSNQVGTAANPINAKLTSGLWSYGGLTYTFALQQDSPAVNAGSTSAAAGLLLDQRGYARVIDGVVDIGAVEYQSRFLVSTLVDESDGNYTTGDLSLREALALAATEPGTQTIQFDPVLALGTINLSGALGQLVINTNVQITGLGSSFTTIRGSGARVFSINSGVTATLADLTVTGGSRYPNPFDPASNGGGIYNCGTLTLQRVVVHGNAALSGGGIAQDAAGASLTIVDSTVRNNTTNAPNGALYITGGVAVIQGSTINNNTVQSGSPAFGSAIYFSGTTLTMTNSTVSGNQHEGVWVAGGTVSILNCTIANNQQWVGVHSAGGVIVTSGAVTLINTIVAGNTGGDTSGGFVATSHHNLIGNGSRGTIRNGINYNIVGTSTSPIDAKLGPLANNGGLTQTHALLAGSPAIDAGDNAAASGLSTDQRGTGFARILDGGHGLLVDIGAYEYHA